MFFASHVHLQGVSLGLFSNSSCSHTLHICSFSAEIIEFFLYKILRATSRKEQVHLEKLPEHVAGLYDVSNL